MHFRLKSPKTSTLTSSSGEKRPFLDGVQQHFLNKQRGENGMPEHTNEGVGSDLLVLSQLVRGGDPTYLSRKILESGSPVDVAYLIVMIFSTRNTRGGKGEKQLAYSIFLEVLRTMPVTALKLLRLFPHYGYWKDLFLLMELVKKDTLLSADTKVMFNRTCHGLLASQLKTDVNIVEARGDHKKLVRVDHVDPEISLLAKWLPREGSSLDKKTGFVSSFSRDFFKDDTTEETQSWESSSKAKYRSTIVKLTSLLQLPEVLLAAHREDEINFGLVASKATFRLRKVFMNEDKLGGVRSQDPKRIRMATQFIEQTIHKGLKGAQLMPHEIVRKVLHSNVSKTEEMVLDAQWKNLRDDIMAQIKNGDAEFDPTKMVPLSDVSGSMQGTPMEVAIALGILISEITHEAFRNLVMTFESNPRWHKLDSSLTIAEKVRSLARAPWGGSTNFKAAYELILDVALKSNLEYKDMPVLIVFSDMQFDEAGSLSGPCNYHASQQKSWLTMHDVIQNRFAEVGEALGWEDSAPTPIVYWNLRNTGGHPADKDQEGVVLLSGFSPSLLKHIMQGKVMEEVEVEVVHSDGTTKKEKVRVTPEQILYKMLNDELYSPVMEIVGSSVEGKLAEVEVAQDEPI
ncbi:protein of unknown function DUF2828 containing protein [Nitzschia inconspicua]|uniref:Uncharacterized protein n=1 Tax=Nitzschia inconspicua TaxID=303405 RepID=A0A9K3M387_9STRA|nr:protein of unknown function DUF2828 containing protein [Nitzschia inconspicua]